MATLTLEDDLSLTNLLIMFDSLISPVYMTSNRKLEDQTEMLDGVIRLIHEFEMLNDTVMF